MKKLCFPDESYDFTKKPYTYKPILENRFIGLLELVWSAVDKSNLPLDKETHAVNRRLKNKLIAATGFKDEDEDSRVASPGPHQLILENDELDLLKNHLEKGNIFSSKITEDISLVWEIIDNAKEAKLAQPVTKLELASEG